MRKMSNIYPVKLNCQALTKSGTVQSMANRRFDASFKFRCFVAHIRMRGDVISVLISFATKLCNELLQPINTDEEIENPQKIDCAACHLPVRFQFTSFYALQIEALIERSIFSISFKKSKVNRKCQCYIEKLQSNRPHGTGCNIVAVRILHCCPLLPRSNAIAII